MSHYDFIIVLIDYFFLRFAMISLLRSRSLFSLFFVTMFFLGNNYSQLFLFSNLSIIVRRQLRDEINFQFSLSKNNIYIYILLRSRYFKRG